MRGLPPFVVRSSEVSEHEGAYPAPFDAEKLSTGRDLGRAAGSRSIGCWRERLPQGRRTSFTHAHLREEELAYVLAGNPVLRWIPPGEAASEVELQPGDFVAFPAGTGIAHCFRNDRPEEAELLVVGERKGGERASYPDDAAYAEWERERDPEFIWTDDAGPTGDGSWPAYRIETARLVMRPWDPADAVDLLRLQKKNQAHLSAFMGWAREIPTVTGMLDRLRGWMASFGRSEDLVYGLFLPDGALIGATGLHPRIGPDALEIGYWVDRDHEGKGYVSEAVAAVTRLALEVRQLDRVEIHCDPRNVRSAKVAERLGFRHEATLPRRTREPEGGFSDSMIWTMYASDAPRLPPIRAWDGVGRRLL